MKNKLQLGEIYYYGASGLPVKFAGYCDPDARKERHRGQTAYFVCQNWHHYQFHLDDIYDTPPNQ